MKEVGRRQWAVGSKSMKGRRRKAEGRRRHLVRFFLFFTACCLLPTAYCFAQGRMYDGSAPLYSPRPELGPNGSGLPPALKEVKIEQKLNEQVPLDLKFRDETGREVQLSEYFNHSKPVILSLVFYKCPMLCNQILTGLLGSLRAQSFDVGKQFEVLTVSFDPRETPADAAEKKESFISRYNRPGASEGWHFLVGDQENIARLTDAVGFRYNYDEKTNQFAHASGIMVLTPEGKLSRYFYGIEYDGRDLRLGLIEASNNKIGSYTDQLLLYCYHYDPATGKYGPVVMNIMRLGGVATVLGIGALVLVLRRRNKKASKESTLAATESVGGAA
ncbi:MAG TPA: SCO family protein [Pyrinomonadaceae bacterium]|nr:SCO family protein [Pyrinomonadaceae bacterium]